MSDAWFELLNLSVNMALWYTKHAAWVAGKDDVREDEAKTVHACLRKAAGVFEFVKENAGWEGGCRGGACKGLDSPIEFAPRMPANLATPHAHCNKQRENALSPWGSSKA